MGSPAPALIADERLLLGEFKTLLDGVSAQWKKAEADIAKQGSISTENAEQIRQLNAKLEDVGAKVAEMAAARVKSDDDIRALKQKGLLTVPNDPPVAKTFGSRLVEMPEWKGCDFNGKFKIHANVAARVYQSKAITTESSGYPVVAQRVGMFAPAQLPLQMRDIVPTVSLSATNAIEYVIENWTYNADYQLTEGAKKAEGTVAYTDATAMVRTIAWFVKISKQMLADVPIIAQTIDSRLIYGVMKKEEHEILWGDNSAGKLHGIMPQATALPAGVLPDATTTIDTVAAAIAHLASLGYPATAIVMNGLTWGNMQISKNSQGAYLLGGPPATDAQPRLWGLPIISTPELGPSDLLVGSFPGNVALFDRETATVDVAYENEDDFVKNLVCFRCEERIALAVFVPAAFVKTTFPAAPPLGREATPAKSENKK